MERKQDAMKSILKTRDMYKLTPPSTYQPIFYTNPEITFLSGKPPLSVNHSREFLSIKSETNPEFSSTITFKIEKKFDILEKLWIRMKLPSLYRETIIDTLREGSVTYTNNNERYEYINGIGYYIFRNIQLKIDGIVVQEITPEELHLYHLMNHDVDETYLHRSQYHGYFGSKGVYTQTNTTYNDEYIVEIPFFFGRDYTNKLPLVSLKNKNVEVTCQLRDLDELWYRPFVQENQCQVSPYEQTVNLSTGAVQTRRKSDMIIEKFELLCSSVYVDIPLREAIMSSDIKKDFLYYQQFEETFQNGGVVHMKIEPTGVAKNIYIMAKTKKNRDYGDFTNLSKEYQSLTDPNRELRRILKNATLTINREKLFLAKKAELLEYQEAERVDYYQNTAEPIIVIPMCNDKVNGSIIWERFDDIQLQINIDTNEEVTIYVICENRNIIRFFSKQSSLLFN